MRFLLVHNNYGKYSGEEAVVDKMAAMFQSHNHTVCFYRLTTEGARDTISDKIKGFTAGIYSHSGVKGIKKILRKDKPDIINVHNLYPFISPAALFECKKAGIPVVMTVHNFRLICPTGLFMRNGKPCEQCLDRKNEWSCIKYNCEHSIFKSIGYTLRNVYARWTKAYLKNVDMFACITEFQKKKLIEAGYDKNKITVIPNSIDAPCSYTLTTGGYIAYIGRLSYEKGYDLLVEVARKHPEIKFCFAGAQREQKNTDIPSNVEFAGYLQKDKLLEFIQKARFIVIPSRCYEGFPMAILEAACHGKPAIAPNHGGFTEIIGQGENAIGKLFEPGNTDDLDKQIAELWNNQTLTEELGEKAFRKLKEHYDSEVVYKQWETLFNKLKAPDIDR
ncbi:glycosyltransferase family 4 protein [Bacteroides salyersiae]|uniref:glycosyltransferase family 4 protein n=1 Tax=Bacteroides salyersiae TaxID=291644 RepID=UPI001CCEDF07|nr:glycosyltransferase family 4 protein [Bacteroides salyersiae]UBD15991.1 glycosyltransferase family 4 protein [Bacteroides salyersiae]